MHGKAYRQREMGVVPLKKSHPPAGEKYGWNNELYDAIKYHNFFTFARWVYDLPGEFCYFLRVVLRTKQILKKFSKRRRLAGSRGCLRIDSSGKGKYHPIPQQKGGEK